MKNQLIYENIIPSHTYQIVFYFYHYQNVESNYQRRLNQDQFIASLLYIYSTFPV